MSQSDLQSMISSTDRHIIKQGWELVASQCFADGRWRWGQQALKYAQMDDPPREWPEDSEPARAMRGEKVSRPSIFVRGLFGVIAALGWWLRTFREYLPAALVILTVLLAAWGVISLAS